MGQQGTFTAVMIGIGLSAGIAVAGLSGAQAANSMHSSIAPLVQPDTGWRGGKFPIVNVRSRCRPGRCVRWVIKGARRVCVSRTRPVCSIR